MPTAAVVELNIFYGVVVEVLALLRLIALWQEMDRDRPWLLFQPQLLGLALLFRAVRVAVRGLDLVCQLHRSAILRIDL